MEVREDVFESWIKGKVRLDSGQEVRGRGRDGGVEGEGGGGVDKLRGVELGVETFYVVQVKNATRVSLKIDPRTQWRSHKRRIAS